MKFLIFEILYFVALPLSSALLAVYLDRSSRKRGFLMVLFGIVVAAAGFAAHLAGMLGTEGSGMMPITLGVGIPLIALHVVRQSRSRPAWLSVALATGAGMISVIPLALLAHYVLSSLVPNAIGCCPH